MKQILLIILFLASPFCLSQDAVLKAQLRELFKAGLAEFAAQGHIDDIIKDHLEKNLTVDTHCGIGMSATLSLGGIYASLAVMLQPLPASFASPPTFQERKTQMQDVSRNVLLVNASNELAAKAYTYLREKQVDPFLEAINKDDLAMERDMQLNNFNLGILTRFVYEAQPNRLETFDCTLTEPSGLARLNIINTIHDEDNEDFQIAVKHIRMSFVSQLGRELDRAVGLNKETPIRKSLQIICAFAPSAAWLQDTLPTKLEKIKSEALRQSMRTQLQEYIKLKEQL